VCVCVSGVFVAVVMADRPVNTPHVPDRRGCVEEVQDNREGRRSILGGKK